MGLTRALEWVGFRAREPLPNIGTIIPTNRADHRHGSARDHADEVAGHFLHWLRDEHPGGCWTSTDLYDTAQWSFCDAVGVTPPPERSLLAALKRNGGIHYRQDCRLADVTGHLVKKATLWSFGSVPGKIWVGDLTRP
ncbi:MAG: hypothetical protein ACKVP3_09235 [Hyphomicrobiaceae bacterium]